MLTETQQIEMLKDLTLDQVLTETKQLGSPRSDDDYQSAHSEEQEMRFDATPFAPKTDTLHTAVTNQLQGKLDK